MEVTSKYLHKIEMDLVNLCEDNEILKEEIIAYFTNLMGEVIYENGRVIKD